MYFKTALVNDETIDGNYISENTKSIDLKDVYAGTQKLIFGQVRTGDYRYLSTKKDAIGKDTNKYSGINKIILTGTHVKNDGTRTEIKKEVEGKIPNATGELQVWGLDEFDESNMKYRIVVETKPNEQYGAQRFLRSEFKKGLDKRNIKVSYPQIEVHNGK